MEDGGHNDHNEHSGPTTAATKDRMDAAMAAVRAAEALFVAQLARYIQDRGCTEDGARTPGDWVGYAYGLTAARAQQYTAAAEAITRRPGLGAALAGGRLTCDQVVAVARRLDSEEAAAKARAEQDEDEDEGDSKPVDVDDETVETARGTSVRDLERAARRARRTSREEAVRQRNQSEVHLSRSRDGHLLFLRGVFAGVDADVIEAVLTRLARQIPDNPDTQKPHPWPHRLALALLIMAKAALGGDLDPDRATVVVHVRPGDAARLGNGHPLAEESFDRLACDARVQALMHNANGEVVAASKLLRTFPPWLRRRIDADADGCEFPSCTVSSKASLCEYHHIGRYDGTNTRHRWGAKLCLFHHWLIHEGGWTLTGDRIAGFQFSRPDGTPFTPGQPHPATTTDDHDPAARLQDILRDLLDQIRQSDGDEAA